MSFEVDLDSAVPEEDYVASSTDSKPQGSSGLHPKANQASEEKPFSVDLDSAVPDEEANQGFLGTLIDGTKSAGRAIGATYDTYTGDGDAVVDKANIQSQQRSDLNLERFNSDVAKNTGMGTDEEVGFAGSVKGIGKAIWDNPKGAAMAVVEQFPNSVPTLAGGWAGAKAGAAAGGAVGSAFAGVGAAPGALIGGTLGFLGGMFVGNTLTETGHKAMEYAGDGEFTADEQSATISEGAKKAGVITTVDALTFGIGGKISSTMRRTAEGAVEAATRKALIDAGVDVSDAAALAAARSNPQIARSVSEAQLNAAKTADNLRRRAAEAGVLLSMETVGEGLGEYLGELAATGQASVSEAVLESFLSLGQSGVQAMFNFAKARENSLTDQEWVDAANGVPPAGMPPEQMPPADGLWDAPPPEASIDMGQMQDSGITPPPVFDSEDFERSQGLTPSQQMGIDPNAGSLSAAAAQAVDSGVFSNEVEQQPGINQLALERQGVSPPPVLNSEQMDRGLGLRPKSTAFDNEAPNATINAEKLQNQGVTQPPILNTDRISESISTEESGQYSVGQKWAKGNRSYTIESVSDDGRSAMAVSGNGKKPFSINIDSEKTNGWKPQPTAQVEQQALAQSSPAATRTPEQDASASWNTMSAIERTAIAEAVGVRGVPAKNLTTKNWESLSDNQRASLTGAVNERQGKRWNDSNVTAKDQAGPVLQPRDRSQQEPIRQMNEIANKPDYSKASYSRTFTDGAPVTIDEIADLPASQRGKQETVSTASERKIPIQYAVVEAEQLLPSNNVDGSSNANYANGEQGKSRSIAGNGRVAGISKAWERGTAEQYKADMIADDLHGIDPGVIQSMKKPVLVRLMPMGEVTDDIGDLSNRDGKIGQSVVERAKEDGRSVDIANLEYDANGNVGGDTVKDFVSKLPGANNLVSNGSVTQEARDRLNAALFQKAYSSDKLTELLTERGEGARSVINAMAIAAPHMTKLEAARGTGFDIRGLVAQAGEIALTAARDGVNFASRVKQLDMGVDAHVYPILEMMANEKGNVRSAKYISEQLINLANLAYYEAQQQGVDMFGERTARTTSQIIDDSFSGVTGDVKPEEATGNEPASQESMGQQGRSEPNAQVVEGPEVGQQRPANTGRAESGEQEQPVVEPAAPKSWRTNYLQAAKVAREKGIDPKQFKKLPELVAAIDAKADTSASQSIEDLQKIVQESSDTDPFGDKHISDQERLYELMKKEAVAEVAAGRPVVYEGVGNNPIHLTITPSAKHSGQYQVTRYNETGALGDSQYNTLDKAFEDNQVGIAYGSRRVSGEQADSLLNRVMTAEAERNQAPSKPTEDTTKPTQVAVQKEPVSGKVENTKVHLDNTADLTSALAAMARGAQVSTEPNGDVVLSGTTIITLPSMPRSIDEVIKPLAEALLEQMRADGLSMPNNPAKMTRDEFVIAYQFAGIIDDFEITGDEIGSLVTTGSNGLLSVNADALYDKIIAQSKADKSTAKTEQEPHPLTGLFEKLINSSKAETETSVFTADDGQVYDVTLVTARGKLRIPQRAEWRSQMGTGDYAVIENSELSQSTIRLTGKYIGEGGEYLASKTTYSKQQAKLGNQAEQNSNVKKQAHKTIMSEWVDSEIKNNKYADSYKKDDGARKEKEQQLAKKWRAEVVEAAKTERIPTIVLDDIASREGEDALFRTFRGQHEKGIDGYDFPTSRMWNKTYRQFTAAATNSYKQVNKGKMKEIHAGIVSEAISRGEPVPDNVRKEVEEDLPASSQQQSEYRSLNSMGEVTDGIGIKPGEQFNTASGRLTTGYPKQKQSRYASQWLIDNAALEAESRGDTFNARPFRSTPIQKDGTLTVSDRESMNEYLFGQQPEVFKSALKDLSDIGDQEAASPELTLEQQTEESREESEQKEKERLDEVKKEEARQAKLERDQREKAADAQAIESSLDRFELGQSADQQLSGQGDVFDVKPDSLAAENELLEKYKKSVMDKADSFAGTYDGRPLKGLAQDFAKHAIDNGRRTTGEENAALAKKYDIPTDVVEAISVNVFTYDGILGDKERGNKQAGLLIQAGRDNARKAEAAPSKPTNTKEGIKQAQEKAKAKKGIAGAIDSVIDEQRAIAKDWADRDYKKNNTKVELGGDGPSNADEMSISSINENRRKKAIESANNAIRVAEKLKAKIAEQGEQETLDWLSAIYDKAENGIGLPDPDPKSKTGKLTQDQFFEQQFLRNIGFDGDRAIGASVSNSLSKAALEAVKKHRASKPKDAATDTANDNRPLEQIVDEFFGETKPAAIEDFGEKIEGARKDLQKSLDVELTDKEISGQTLSKIWPIKEMEAIEDPYAAALSYVARSHIPAKPRVAYKLARWVEAVKLFRDIAKRVNDGRMPIEQLKAAGVEKYSLKGVAEKVELLMELDRKDWPRIGMVEVQADAYNLDDNGEKVPAPNVLINIDGKYVRLNGLTSISEAVGLAKAALSGSTAVDDSKKMAFDIRQSRVDGRIFINKKGDREYRELKVFAKGELKQARDFVKNNHDELVAAWDAVKERDNVGKGDMRKDTNMDRVGKDYRGGKDVTPEQFIEAFGFRGVQFGNWVKQGAGAKDRQGLLNATYDAFMDLAQVVGAPPQAISLNGTLGFAFGARGKSKFSAHFEPDQVVINLTKTKGAGSLAHEWFHALDNHFSRMRETDVSVSANLSKGNYITYMPEPMMAYKKTGQRTDTQEYFNKASAKNSDYYNLDNFEIDKNHPKGVRPVIEKAFSTLVNALDNSPMSVRAKNIDGGKADGYWSRIIERAARSFENYVIAKLDEQGLSNDFLANVVSVEDFKRDTNRYPYLKPEEIKPVAEAFDSLFGTIEYKKGESGTQLFSLSDNRNAPATVTTNASLLKTLSDNYPSLVTPVITMLKKGRTGAKGGLIIVNSNDSADIAAAYSKATGEPFGKAIRLFSDGETINGFYDVSSGITFLIGPNLDAASAPAVLLHEVTHSQQRKGIDERALNLIDNRGKEKNADLKAFLDTVAQRMESAGEAGNATEATTYIVEQAVLDGKSRGYTVADSKFLSGIEKVLGSSVANIVRDFIKMVRQFALRNNMPINISLDDLVQYAMASVEQAAAGKSTNKQSQGQNYSFAGERALTASKANLSKAQDMIIKGMDADEVRQETGWFQGADENWRFELNDSDAAFVDAPSLDSYLAGKAPRKAKLNKQDQKQLNILKIAETVAKKEMLADPVADRDTDKWSALYDKWSELSDKVRALENKAQGKFTELGEVIEHEQLFAAYPDMKAIKVQLAIDESSETNGSYDRENNKIVMTAPNKQELMGGVLHEIQHAIQKVEAFARGGTPRAFSAKDVTSEYLKRLGSDLITLLNSNPKFGSAVRAVKQEWIKLTNKYPKTTNDGQDSVNWDAVPQSEQDVYFALMDATAAFDEADKWFDIETKQRIARRDGVTLTAFEQYQRLAGEVEARNVETRLFMTDEERREFAPEATEDVDRADQSVRFSRAQTKTAAFKKWFGDSKVVDANGEPTVMYHGTASDFSEFSKTKATDKEGRKISMGWGKGKFYFASTGEAASSSAQFAQSTGRGSQQNVMPVYLSIENPIDAADYMSMVYEQTSTGKTRDAAIAAVDKKLKKQGVDGIVDSASGGMAVFEPTQIKSATGNNGDFDGNNPDIRFSRAPKVGTEAFNKMFGETKAVDDNGNPKMLYHGTNADITSFEKSMLGANTLAESAELGFFFTDDITTAESYANYAATTGKIDKLYREADKAADNDDWDAHDDLLTQAETLEAKYSDPKNRQNGQNIIPVYIAINNPLIVDAKGEDHNGFDIPAAIKKAKKEKRDGLIIKNLDDAVGLSNRPATHYVAFNSEQIKSAIGNNGNYDSTNPDIRYSRMVKGDNDENLYVAHNLTEDNLRYAVRLGGLAAPSLAVGNIDTGAFNNFGEITLLARPELLGSPKARTFDADVYTPRHPRAEYEVSAKAWRELKEKADNLPGDLRFPTMNDVERDGAKAFLYSDGAKLLYLQEQGKAPATKPVKTEPWIKKAAAIDVFKYDLANNKQFQKLVTKEAERIYASLVEAGLDVAERREHFYFTTNEDGTRQVSVSYLTSSASKVVRYMESGGIDDAQLRADVNKKLRTKKSDDDFKTWVNKQLDEIVTRKRIDVGETASGNRKYIPYNLDNIVKTMTRELRGGEGYNYGPGSIRAMYANELKSLSAVKARRNQIISAEQFDEIKDESGKKVSKALIDLQPFYRFDSNSFTYEGDATSAIAEGPAAWKEAFEITEESRKIITDLIEYLRTLPTEYFETKVGRAVDIKEFSYAIVPSDASSDIPKLLREKGIQVKRYKANDNESREQAIRSTKGILFSKKAKEDALKSAGIEISDNRLGKTYTDKNGATISVMEGAEFAPRENSVTNFVVPENARGRGVGSALLKAVVDNYGAETMSAAASSESSVRAFYSLGFRPGFDEKATLASTLERMKEWSSVTMLGPKSDTQELLFSKAQTKTPAFKKLFGNSKVVDANGEPLVVYHGTQSSEFNIFENQKQSNLFGAKSQFYFTDNQSEASGYATGNADTIAKGRTGEGRVIAAFLKIDNPADLRSETWNVSDVDVQSYLENMDMEGLYDALVSAGYDGIIYDSEIAPIPVLGNHYVVFNSTQIKSATDNNGDFDGNNPDIRYSRAYHGSPHKFDRFSLEAMGSGEGAQAYGWGLYFAENREIAEHYRDVLGYVSLKPKDESAKEKLRAALNYADGAASEVEAISQQLNYDDNKIAAELVKMAGRLESQANGGNPYYIDAYRTMAEMISAGELETEKKSNLYQVDIPEKDELISWDNALTESEMIDLYEKMQATPLYVFARDFQENWYSRIEAGRNGTDGQDFYMELSKELGGDKAASQYLNSIGVKGIYYLDGVSRKNDGEKNNYVIWDETAVTIEAVNDQQKQADIMFSRFAATDRLVTEAEKAMKGADGFLDRNRKIPGNWTQGQKDAARKFDTFTPRQPIASKIKQMKEATADRAAQLIFDQFRPLRNLSEEAFMQAHLARGAEGALEALATKGLPKLKDGAIAVDVSGGGFIGALSKLGDMEEVRKFLMWVAANRADNLMSEGRENLFTDDDIAAMKQFATGTTASGQVRRLAYGEALTQLNAYNKAVLDIAQEAGLVNGEARQQWESDFYIPFYRVLADEDGVISKKHGHSDTGLMRQEVIKRLKGGKENLGDPLENVMANWSSLLTSSMKNMAANKALEQGVVMGIAEETNQAFGNQLWTMQDGKKKYWEVHDKYVLESLEALNFSGYNNGFMKAAGAFKRMLTIGVTISPTFRVRNLIRDTLHAIAVADTSYNPLKNAVEGWKMTSKENDTMAQLMAGGGAVRFGSFNDGQAGNYVERMIKNGIQDGQILNTPAKMKKALGRFYTEYQEIGDRSETINRAVVYQRVLEKTGSHLEASFAARDLMNFTSMGSAAAIRALSQILPFFNARLQGLDKLGRGAVADPRRFWSVAGTIGMASALLFLLQGDDDEYKALPDYIRDTYWPVKLGGTWLYIPKPFEIGSMGTVVERFTELMFSDGDYKAKDFKDSLIGVLINNLEMNPVPQIIRPASEAWFNYDMFRQQPIDSMAMDRLMPEDRHTANTSTAAVIAGQTMGVSPQKIEHLIRGYFGWLGTQALNVGDILGRTLTDRPSSPKWDLSQTNNMFIVGDFLKEAGSTPSKYSTRFYDVQRDIDRIYATANNARKVGDMDRFKELVADPKMKARPLTASANNRMTLINQQIRATLANRTISASEKNERINKLHKIREEIAKKVDEVSRK